MCVCVCELFIFFIFPRKKICELFFLFSFVIEYDSVAAAAAIRLRARLRRVEGGRHAWLLTSGTVYLFLNAAASLAHQPVAARATLAGLSLVLPRPLHIADPALHPRCVCACACVRVLCACVCMSDACVAPSPALFSDYLAHARSLVAALPTDFNLPDQSRFLGDRWGKLRWFLLPSEALEILKANNATPTQNGTAIVVNTSAQEAIGLTGLLHPLLYGRNSISSASVRSSSRRLDDESLEAFGSSSSSSSSSDISNTNVGIGGGVATVNAPLPGTSRQPLTLTSRQPGNTISLSGAPSAISENSATDSTNAHSHDNASTSTTSTSRDSSSTPTTHPEKLSQVAGDSKEAASLCKNCFHTHWASGKQCTSCACVNFIAHVPSSKKEIKIQEKRLAKLVGKAVQDFRMINEGDRVLVGVSGGKDSLTLVNILRGLQARAPIKFELGCVTVDPQTPEYDPSKLKTYFASLGIPYFYESQPILASAAACMDPKRVSICSFCSRMKRGILYATLRREKYNVLALGQHLDDLAESFVMSAFHNGALRTMKVRVRGMTRGYVPGRLLQTHIH